ncbi:MAG: SDR family NAD(P)-dependent oxidoreductase [Terracoccus sp.]
MDSGRRRSSTAGGSRALVTGASSGIGRATALLLAEQGWDVALLSRSEDVLEQVAQECRRHGVRAVVVPADVSDEPAVEAAFAAAVEGLGGLDAVVHSAASLAYGRFEDVPSEVFRGTTETTLHGTIHVARAALTHFRRHGERGSLVFVGSLLGKIATPFMSSYVTSKWAVHGLVRTLQIEARATPDIGISLISPGGVDTPVYRQGGTYLGVHGSPPPPVSTPEQVAAAVVAAIDHPERDRGVGIANPLVVFGFRVLPPVFDRIVTPLMRLGGLSREKSGPTPGNVLSPVPGLEALRGGYKHGDDPAPGQGTTAPGWTSASTEVGRPDASESAESSRSPQTPHTASRSEDPTSPENASRVSRRVDAPAEVVWAVLEDGWSYCHWVVGTSTVRGVDDGWPRVNRRIHHSVGGWPLTLEDSTLVLESEPGVRLVMEARGWPMGKAKVTVEIEQETDETCVVTILEDAVAGPGASIPKPVRQAVIVPRNRESLRRLARLAEGRQHEAGRRADGSAVGAETA